MQPLLEMRGISKAYGEVRANRSIDLDVPAGAIVGLLGENGSGKSTLMKVLFGMLAPDAGGVVFKGRELASRSPAEALAAPAYALLLLGPHLGLVLGLDLLGPRLVALVLRSIAVDAGGLHAHLIQILSQTVGAVFGAHKHQKRSLLLLQ